MRVEVLRSFKAGDKLLVRGDVVIADGWRNLSRLLSSRYVREAEDAAEDAEKPQPRRRGRPKKQG